MVKLILDIDNTDFFQKVTDFIKNEKSDFWNDLSLAEQNEIRKGIADLDKRNRIPYTDFLKKIS